MIYCHPSMTLGEALQVARRARLRAFYVGGRVVLK